MSLYTVSISLLSLSVSLSLSLCLKYIIVSNTVFFCFCYNASTKKQKVVDNLFFLFALPRVKKQFVEILLFLLLMAGEREKQKSALEITNN